MKIFKPLSLCSFLLISLTHNVHAADPAEAKTIGRVVRERPDLSSLLKLLDKTALGSSLSEDTGIRKTLFAPNDEAFKKLPKDALKTLLDPRNDDRLEEVFAFHVFNQTTSPWELENYSTLQMSTGQFVNINYGKNKIDNALFTGEVISCSNGRIYIIDSVLNPVTDDLFQKLLKDGRFKTFTKAITASRQGKLFQNVHASFTTFAPTDKAFEKLPKGFVESLFLPENDERLEDIIKHHISSGIFQVGKSPGYKSLGVTDVTPISAFGQQLNYKTSGDSRTIDGAKIVEADITAANGIIHVIDSVIPPVEKGLMDLLKEDEKFSKLVEMLKFTGLDSAVASSTNFTIFAPVNSAWENEKYTSLLSNRTDRNRDILYGILSRHVIIGKHVSENCVPYEKLRTIIDAPIYLERDGDIKTISNIEISETDTEGFNGLINTISKVIPDQMELPEGDISLVDAIEFVQETLDNAAPIYANGDFIKCWRYYEKRGYEFLSKYETKISSSSSLRSEFKRSIIDNQPVVQFAEESWKRRNTFRNVLRFLEVQEDRIQDAYLMQSPKKPRFGR
tara:strand:+ start:192 stop:1883 length:1692 start_codon:yes stop_codon:yes gene_type:complete